MTEARKGLPVDLVQFLIDRLPPEEIAAAKTYLKVLKSQAADPDLWFDGGTPNETNIHSQRKDLLYRSLWFTEDHILSMNQIMAIFHLKQEHQEEPGIKNKFDRTDLYNFLHTLITWGKLDWQGDLRVKLPRELVEKAERFTRSE